MVGRPPMTELGAIAVLAVSLTACRQTVLFDDPPDGGAGGLDGGSAYCPGGEARRLSFTIETPEVIVAIDRSTSMNAVFAESTRVALARDVVEKWVRRYQTISRFGHIDFPGRACGEGASCCRGDVTPPTSNFDAFQTALRACTASGASCAVGPQRPVAATLDAAHDTFERLGQSGHRAVLVLTDGPPTCGNNPCSEAYTEASAMADDHISIHVVTVGTPVSSDCLRILAGIGLTEAQSASSPESLETVVGDILDEIARTACRIDVSSTPDNDEQVALLHHGVPLPYDDREGWDFDDGSTLGITLHGSACQLLLDEGPEGFDLRACRPAP